MLKLISHITGAALLTFAVWFFPTSAQAMTATLVSISPDATDISDQMTGAPESVQMFAWLTTLDTVYTATFTVDEQPAMVVTPGASISIDNQPTYDATTGEYVITFTATGVKGDFGGQELPEGQGMSIIALSGAVAEGEDGPPAEMAGGWMSTNIQEWEMIPPSQEQIAFGYNLTGPAGETGFLHMFIPGTLIDLLSAYSGQELVAEDLAVFNGDEQASLAVTEVDGGAYIDINVVFVEEATTVLSSEGDTSVRKEITVAEQLPVSLAASKMTVSKGKSVTLYGWLENQMKNQTVTLWRKLKNEDKYVKWKTLSTKEDGYFKARFVAKKTGSYKVKYNNDGETVVSEVTTITVE